MQAGRSPLRAALLGPLRISTPTVVPSGKRYFTVNLPSPLHGLLPHVKDTVITPNAVRRRVSGRITRLEPESRGCICTHLMTIQHIQDYLCTRTQYFNLLLATWTPLLRVCLTKASIPSSSTVYVPSTSFTLQQTSSPYMRRFAATHGREEPFFADATVHSFAPDSTRHSIGPWNHDRCSRHCLLACLRDSLRFPCLLVHARWYR
jgi:hypothetical protein